MCGGSLITENLVLSAAHCVNQDYETFIALGMHNVSGFTKWSEQELKKYVIRNVKETVIHPKHKYLTKSIGFDFALFLLETPVKISNIISPVCLPRPNELDSLESKKNILIGFGLSRLWFHLYNELLGGELQHAPLIPLKTYLYNQTALLDKLEEPNFQENIIRGYFKNFKEIFPGIEACIDDSHTFVKKCLDAAKNEEIVKNIADKLS